jgi:hypothetical protein
MADEDSTGAIVYQEFVRKFSAYKNTASMHKDVGYKSEADAKAAALHGVTAGSRMAKTSQERKSQNIVFSMDKDQYGEGEEHGHTIQSLSRMESLMTIPAEEATPDQIRAKIYRHHGNLLNAFRQMDNSGDSRISYEEFQYFIPKVLKEPISAEKVAELWRSIDVDGTGEIDIEEFASGKLTGSEASQRAVNALKDMAVDPTMGQKADHQKVATSYSGLGIEKGANAPALGAHKPKVAGDAVPKSKTQEAAAPAAEAPAAEAAEEKAPEPDLTSEASGPVAHSTAD